MRRRLTHALLLGLLPACSVASHRVDDVRVGLRMDAGRSSMDAEYSEDYPSQAPVRQESSFDTTSVGVEAEIAGRHLGGLFSLRRHDVSGVEGNLAVDGSFEEIGIGVRGYLGLVDGLRLFGDAQFVVLAGLDFGRAESPIGARLGAGVAWDIGDQLAFEVRARYMDARIGSREEDELGQPIRRRFDTEIDGFEWSYGLTWWF